MTPARRHTAILTLRMAMLFWGSAGVDAVQFDPAFPAQF